MITNEEHPVGTQNISVRTDERILELIDEVAQAQDRSRNWWINQAIKKALDDELAWIKQVERAVAAADSGEFASEAEVDAVFQRLDDDVK